MATESPTTDLDNAKRLKLSIASDENAKVIPMDRNSGATQHPIENNEVSVNDCPTEMESTSEDKYVQSDSHHIGNAGNDSVIELDSTMTADLQNAKRLKLSTASDDNEKAIPMENNGGETQHPIGNDGVSVNNSHVVMESTSENKYVQSDSHHIGNVGNDSFTELDSTINADENLKNAKCLKLSTALDDNEKAIPMENKRAEILHPIEDDGVSVNEFPTAIEPTIEHENTEGDSQICDANMEKIEVHEPQGDRERCLFQYKFIELGRRLWPSTVHEQKYTKACLWSPDGSCVLVPVHLDGMHLIELPFDLYTAECVDTERDLSTLESAVHVKEGGTVYDCAWYPFMNSTQPETCCWISTRKHEPIHMWDAFNGELRCSYRGYDDVDEMETAISVTFSCDGNSVIAGYKKSIKIFDTNIPGRDYTCKFPVKQAVSCFALTENNDTVTTGSWKGLINHYDLRAPKLGPLFTLGGHTGGITLLRYVDLPEDNLNGGPYLFSGARKDNYILKWDMRNYTEPVQKYFRNVETNQRIYFDVSEDMWLVSGDTKGLVRLWDLSGNNEEANLKMELHEDCCNGVSFHPFLPVLASSSGQYHTLDGPDDDEMSSKQLEYENSLVLHWYGKNNASK